jgi:hypothetical protein
MRKHKGMRPQDILVLLKILALEEKVSRVVDLAHQLQLSQSEVSEALNRCRVARLLNPEGYKVYRGAFLEFIIYGLKYVFPAHPGEITRGIPTAHSAPPLAHKILSGEAYVWPSPDGTTRGQAIEPLYPTVPAIVSQDPALHELLALIDALRVGSQREQALAVQELTGRIKG